MTFATVSKTDVIIGGGATSAEVARDCALRGLKGILDGRGDIVAAITAYCTAAHATWITDQESTQECIAENAILNALPVTAPKPHKSCLLPSLDFQQQFVEACQSANIDTQPLTPALTLEPAVNPAIIGAVKVPDGTVDPFRLAAANMLDAREHGAIIRTGFKVTGLIRQDVRVCDVTIQDRTKQTTEPLYICPGRRQGRRHLGEYTELSMRMFPEKGSLLIFENRINQHMINRCRYAGCR